MNQQSQWQVAGSAPEIYERELVPAVFGAWAPVLVDLAQARSGHRVVDVACGTGIVARIAAMRVVGVADHFHLFMIPGMDHCGLPAQMGPGITESGFDPLTALEKWVEDGVAPDSLLATKADKDGNVLWTRPLCPFPQKAMYRGAGDTKDAANYRCE